MIIVDESCWPLMQVRFSGPISDRQFTEYLERLGQVLGRREIYATVVITEPHSPMTQSKHARMQADWIGEHEDDLRRYNLGLGFVLPNPLFRGVLKAILWMQPMPVPHQVFATVPQGFEWCRQRLDAAGIEVPEQREIG